MKECECDTPKQFLDPRKRICRVCSGFVSRSTEELGRLHTKLDAAVVSLDLPENELRLFLRRMNECVSADTVHKYRTWSHNHTFKQRGGVQV
jgi:hypothetical protein